MFSPLRTNPLPLRAAIQIGCDNLVTGTAARIDAIHGAIREGTGGLGGTGLHAEVPIAQPRVIIRGQPGDPSSSAFLDEGSIAEATNALRKVVTRLSTLHPNEFSILMMPPFDRVANTPILREMWQRELKCKVHLFRDMDFEKPVYLHMLNCRRNEETSAEFDGNNNNNHNNKNIETNFKEQREIAKMRAIQQKRKFEHEMKRLKNLSSPKNGDEIEIPSYSSNPFDPIRTAENFEWCWFMAHIVAAKNMAPQRMLFIKENTQFAQENDENEEQTSSASSFEIIGCDFVTNNNNNEGDNNMSQKIKLLKWSIPSSLLSVPNAHRIMYEQIQRRPIQVYKGHMNHSLNPMTRNEVLQLVNFLVEKNNSNNNKEFVESSSTSSPNWVIERLLQDGVVCGSSTNGGLLNTCARIAGSVSISVEKLEQMNEFHYAGLSDTLLGQNYPHPSLVCVQGAVFSVLCRHLLSTKNSSGEFANERVMCRRVAYLPEVSVTHAMLTHPDMWMVNSATAETQRTSRFNIAHSQEQHQPYPKQAIDRFDPNRVRW
jgi:hypothetical protein